MNAQSTLLRTQAELLIYQADLDRLARRMRKMGRACTLTALARRWVRGRLRYGTESGDIISLPESTPVRFWDPGEVWHPGDWAVFPVAFTRNGVRRRKPRAGQIVRVMGTSLTAQIDGEMRPRLWGIPASRDDVAITRWRASLDRHIDRLETSDREDARIDWVLFRQGAAIMSRLLVALGADGRFIEWEGEWFLHSLVEYPSETRLCKLARTMLTMEANGVRLSELLSQMPDVEVDNPATIFGFALAMSERPDLFTKVKTGRYTRWSLVSPPSGEYEAKFPVFDPQTYEIVCEPGDRLTADEVQRLWALRLLATALYGTP